MQQAEIEFGLTDVFQKIANNTDKRILCLYGGSSSSKTISALQYLTMWGEEAKLPLVITVIGESVPVIKKSVFRDWQRIVMQGKFEAERYNKQDNTYYFPGGSLLQFIPADDDARFFAMRHDIVLIDEAYNVSKSIFDQVEIRTRMQILLTWNPVAEFWAKKLEDERDDVAVIHATYHDNPYIEQSIIDALETRAKTDPNFYRVFVLGQYGNYEGLIFREGQHWAKCKAMPEDYKRRLIGVDFGFSHDPTAMLDIRYAAGEFWVDELAYDTGMHNSEIGAILKAQEGERMEVIADSAEPKSIAEIGKMGVNIRPCEKGPDSVTFGLRTMQSFKINITERSLNTIKEFRNYAYTKTRQGEYIDKPIDNWNHSIDALRYGITHVRKKPTYQQYSIS